MAVCRGFLKMNHCLTGDKWHWYQQKKEITMRSLRGLKVLGICLSFSLLACCTSAEREFSSKDLGGGEINGADRIVYPEQNWDAADSLWFYNTTQGSNLMYYDIFFHLEQAKDEQPFRDKTNMEKYRFLTQKKSPSRGNPDGLPVGWVKNSYNGEDWIGLTCAACHTSQINYQPPDKDIKYGIRIDGGQAMADVEWMMLDLEEAMEKNLSNPEKFDRLAEKILKDGKSDQEKKDLGERLEKNLARLKCINEMDSRTDRKRQYGYARLDAFGRILNRINQARNPPCSHVGPKPANAPVSYPFLWDTPQSDFVQWNGSLDNGGAGGKKPLGRNTSEVLGVFGHFTVEFDSETEELSSDSSANSWNQVWMEHQIASLQSPRWEQLAEKDYLPKIDDKKVKDGKKVFDEYQCESCHISINRTDSNRRVIAQMASLNEIGTDRTMADNFLEYCMDKTEFDPKGSTLCRTEPNNQNKIFGPVGLRNITTNILKEGGLLKTNLPAFLTGILNPMCKGILNPICETERHVDFELVNKLNLETLKAYKARSLNGIWATAPYLHNGSVPNLKELFLPSECKEEDTPGKTCRSKKFTVGNLEFDHDNVGFKEGEDPNQPGVYTFDTTKPGNSNTGHEYAAGVTPIISRDINGIAVRKRDGTFETDNFDKITPQERDDLIEYLKTL